MTMQHWSFESQNNGVGNKFSNLFGGFGAMAIAGIATAAVTAGVGIDANNKVAKANQDAANEARLARTQAMIVDAFARLNTTKNAAANTREQVRENTITSQFQQAASRMGLMKDMSTAIQVAGINTRTFLRSANYDLRSQIFSMKLQVKQNVLNHMHEVEAARFG